MPEARRTPASRLVTPEVPRAVGTLLARREALRQEARPVLSAEPPELHRALVGVASVGAVATVGAAATDGVGEGGASAWNGPTGHLGGASPSLLGGADLIGILRG